MGVQMLQVGRDPRKIAVFFRKCAPAKEGVDRVLSFSWRFFAAIMRGYLR